MTKPWNCGQTHTQKRDGAWRRGDATESFRAVLQSNGRVSIKAYCQTCRIASGPLPTAQLAAWGVQWHDVTDVRVNAAATAANFPPCSYENCDGWPTEYHHFAPYNTFGDDANNWPVMPLCAAHHRQWHQTMDGYRWHKRGIWRDAS